MIAIALIALCALPLMRPYAAVQVSHATHNAQAKINQLADLEILQVKEKLYNGTILWEEILNSYQSSTNHFTLQIQAEGDILSKDHNLKQARILINLTPKSGLIDDPISYMFFATIPDPSQVENKK